MLCSNTVKIQDSDESRPMLVNAKVETWGGDCILVVRFADSFSLHLDKENAVKLNALISNAISVMEEAS